MPIKLELATLLGCLLLATSSAFGSPDAGVTPSDQGPDCHGFGGLVHGASACARLDLKTSKVLPLTERVMPRAAAGQLGCEKSLSVKGHTLRLTCTVEGRPDASHDGDRQVSVAVSLDGKPPVVLDRHRGYWSSINVWVALRAESVDFTVDYLVLD